MKKHLLAIVVATLFVVGCKEDSKEKEEKSTETELTAEDNKKKDLTILSGEFIYVEEQKAAVLKTNNEVYGVVLDSMATELSKEVNALKREDLDMVPVIIQGEIKPNPQEDGWKEVVEIKKIIKVMTPKTEPAIRVKGDNKEEK